MFSETTTTGLNISVNLKEHLSRKIIEAEKMPHTNGNGIIPSHTNDNSIVAERDEPATRPGNLFTEQISQEYHNNPETGYYIPTTTLDSAANRKLRIITVGAGMSGIMLAHDIERDCENVDHVIYEKNPEVGGTWVCLRVYPWMHAVLT